MSTQVLMPSQGKKRIAPVWLMGLSNTTFGLVSGFIVLPLPQMLAAQGVPEAKIAAVSAACFLPGFWTFLLGPVLDIRFSRRWYATLFAVLAGVLLTVAVLCRGQLLWLEFALMLSYTAAVMASNALGGWLAGVIPDVAGAEGDTQNHEGAKLSAWTQVGTFLGNGMMAGLAGEALRKLPLGLAAVLLGALVVLPAAIFPFIPVRERLLIEATGSVLGQLGEGFRKLFRELGVLFKRQEVLLALALFLAPTGSFALSNQLGGVASDFHAPDAFVSRIGGMILTVAGGLSCLLLPVLARRVKALPLYLMIGVAGSVFTLLLLVLPRNEWTFALAFLGENSVQALSFTAAVAICFQTIGRNNPLAGTQFSLLTAATVLPITYMGVLDGRIYGAGGLARMYLVDGGLSLAACGLLAAVMWKLRLGRRLGEEASLEAGV